MNSFQKALLIITSPLKALSEINRKPNIMVPLLIIIVFPMLYYLIFWNNLEPKLISDLENKMLGLGFEPTMEMIELQMKILRITYPLQGVFTALIGGLISGTYYFICAKIAKSKVRFKKIISLVYHVAIISTLAVVLNMILTAVGMAVSLTEPITSLASLLPDSIEATFFYGAAMTVEVFTIWGTIVTYFGLQIVADMSKKAALITVLLGYALSMTYVGGSMVLSQLASNLV